jgi:D-serine deaminase-like pyridoxal phosphate-dependent protein
VRRIHLATEVVGAHDLTRLRDLLAADPDIRVQCWVDSGTGLARLAEAVAVVPGRVEVLVDVGTPGGRTGVRGRGDARRLGAAVRGRPEVRLVGVAGYEGVVGNQRDAATLARIDRHCAAAADVFTDLAEDYETAEPVFTMGGSAFPDRVVEHRPPDARVVLRSGCYVTHDHGTYAAVTPLPALRPALAVDALVLSTPEPGLAVLDAGRRDLPHDAGLPVVLAPEQAHEVTTLYDHHAVLRGEPTPGVGDVVRLGISHPCSAFSRWERYLVVRGDEVVDRWSTEFVRR